MKYTGLVERSHNSSMRIISNETERQRPDLSDKNNLTTMRNDINNQKSKANDKIKKNCWKSDKDSWSVKDISTRWAIWCNKKMKLYSMIR